MRSASEMEGKCELPKYALVHGPDLLSWWILRVSTTWRGVCPPREIGAGHTRPSTIRPTLGLSPHRMGGIPFHLERSGGRG